MRQQMLTIDKVSIEERPCEFVSFYHVEADDRYDVVQTNGFKEAGVFFTYDGCGEYWNLKEKDPRVLKLQRGTFLFVPKGIVCQYRCIPNGHWNFYFIHFLHLSMIASLDLPILSVGHIKEPSSLVMECKAMMEGIILKKQHFKIKTNHRLNKLFLSLADEQTGQLLQKDPQFASILLWIHNHLHESIRIETLIRMSGMSRTLFFNRFKNMTGMTPSIYNQHKKLDSAKSMLETTDLTLRAVANALSFYDEYHFSRQFKQYTGMSPSQYRKQVRLSYE